VAVIDRHGDIHTHGDTGRRVRIASVSKLFTAWATMIAVEEGTTSLSQPVGQEGCTVRHLLAHAGGYSFGGVNPIKSPARKRIYSNTGIELLAAHVGERAGVDFADYLREAVCDPLGLASTHLEGSAAKDVVSNVDDCARFMAELRRPRLLSRDTVRDMTNVQFPELEGVVPGLGRFDPCPWGLGPEIRGTKAPHWTAPHGSAATWGHFGGTGTFLWVDPVADVACVMLSNREFTDWGMEYWPAFNDAVLAEARATRG
jgi:CubicO group peptidase (beta-lactamase class C family)